MNKLVATVIALGVFFVGVLVGGYFVFGMSEKVTSARLAVYDGSDFDAMSRYAALTRALGSPEAYEGALQELLRFLDVREHMDGVRPGLSPQSIAVERALTNARLAMLATERSDSAGAARYWSQAQALCPLLQWSPCTVESLTRVVRRLDEQSIWNVKEISSPGHGS